MSRPKKVKQYNTLAQYHYNPAPDITGDTGADVVNPLGELAVKEIQLVNNQDDYWVRMAHRDAQKNRAEYEQAKQLYMNQVIYGNAFNYITYDEGINNAPMNQGVAGQNTGVQDLARNAPDWNTMVVPTNYDLNRVFATFDSGRIGTKKKVKKRGHLPKWW